MVILVLIAVCSKLREWFSILHSTLQQHYEQQKKTDDVSPLQVLASLIVLRFFCPTLVSPAQFGFSIVIDDTSSVNSNTGMYGS